MKQLLVILLTLMCIAGCSNPVAPPVDPIISELACDFEFKYPEDRLNFMQIISQAFIMDSINIAYPDRGPIIWHRNLKDAVRWISGYTTAFNETFEQTVKVNNTLQIKYTYHSRTRVYMVEDDLLSIKFYWGDNIGRGLSIIEVDSTVLTPIIIISDGIIQNINIDPVDVDTD